MRKGSKPILGKQSCADLGLIQHVPAESIEYTTVSKDNLIKQYHDVFTGLGRLPSKYHIEIDSECTPVIHPPRKVPAALHRSVQEELQRMEDLGVITKQDSPTDNLSKTRKNPHMFGSKRP